MPLRAKPGQSTITVIVGGSDPAAIAAGKRVAKGVADYYGAGGAAPAAVVGAGSAEASATAAGAASGSKAGDAASDYFAAGAASGAGGRWCLSARRDGPGLPIQAADTLEALGVLPTQQWSGERLEALLLGAGRRGHGRAVDPVTGEQQPAVRTHAWTFDLVKSLSLLAVYGQEDWLLQTVEQGARVAMDMLVSTALLVRRREGREIVHERAAALHYSLVVEKTARAAVTSRTPGVADVSGVPGLHFHGHLLLHFAVNDRGQLCAVDVDDALQQGWRRLASAVADAAVVAEARRRGIPLRSRAPERVGASWSAEVATIPDAAIEAASERHRVIAAARAGTAAGPTSDLAAERLTKAPKDIDVDGVQISDHWRAVIEARGARNPFDPGDPEAGGADAGGGSPSDPGAPASVEDDALRATFADRSTAGWQSVLADVVLRGAVDWVDEEDLWRRATTLPQQLEADGVLVALRDGSLTTQAILDQEQRIVRAWQALATAPVSDRRGALPAALREERAASGHDLDEGQLQLVEAALSRGAVLGVGVAGAGKTAALATLRRAVEASGGQLHVAAMAALRARESRLTVEGHSDTSIRGLVVAAGGPAFSDRYHRGDVVVIDEASQLGDDDLDAILAACVRDQVGLVLLGDPKQQGPIGRGAMFTELARRGRVEQRPEYVELTSAHRFEDPAMAAALAAYRSGKGELLASYLSERGGLVETASQDATVAAIARAWMADPTQLVLTTGSNLRRDEIGDAIVAQLVAAGTLQPRAVEVQADADNGRRVQLHVGEEIRCNRQLWRDVDGQATPLLANGETAHLEEILDGAGDNQPALRLRCAGGRRVEVDAADLVATHACVMGSYKAQGATATSVLLDWQDGTDLQRAYPALSRQRRQLTVYLAPEEEAFDDGRRHTPAERLQLAARRDHAPVAASTIGPGAEPSAELAALAAAPRYRPSPAGPEEVVEAVDELRVAAAARGELDARTLTPMEFDAAMRRAISEPALGQRGRELALLRGPTAGAGGSHADGISPAAPGPRPAMPRWMEELATGSVVDERAGLRIEVVRQPQLTVPWQPSPSQRPALLAAEREWAEVERAKTRVLVAGLRRVEELGPDRAGALLAGYRQDLAGGWRRLAEDHGVSRADQPELHLAGRVVTERLEQAAQPLAAGWDAEVAQVRPAAPTPPSEPDPQEMRQARGGARVEIDVTPDALAPEAGTLSPVAAATAALRASRLAREAETGTPTPARPAGGRAAERTSDEHRRREELRRQRRRDRDAAEKRTRGPSVGGE